jgi:hypothetical protein
MSRNQRFRMVARESPMEDGYAPNLVGGGQGLALLHQNLRLAMLLIKYLLTEHYRSVQYVFNLTNALMVLRLDLIVASAIVFLQNLIKKMGFKCPINGHFWKKNQVILIQVGRGEVTSI